MRVVGLMSGTSVDGIDVAVADLEPDGETLFLTPVADLDLHYRPEVRNAVLATLPPATTDIGAVNRMDAEIGQELARAAKAGIEAAGGAADLVVSHGQTVHHWVEDGEVRGTLQVGEAAWIAEATGLPVIANLRNRDVAAGGQGAPLVSRFDALLLAAAQAPVAALNIGGIANVTVVGPDREPTAFDTGPGNALIDLAVQRWTAGAETRDEGGARARRGRVDQRLLDTLLADTYYARPAPKSTGKERFHADYLDAALARAPVQDLDDLLATLTALTAETIADACRDSGVTNVVAAGGGVHNGTLMRRLRSRLDSIGLDTMEAFGLPSGAKEAYAFAVLGWLTWHGIAGTMPSCTGARHASVLGSVTPGRSGRVGARDRPPEPRRIEIVTAGAGCGTAPQRM